MAQSSMFATLKPSPDMKTRAQLEHDLEIANRDVTTASAALAAFMRGEDESAVPSITEDGPQQFAESWEREHPAQADEGRAFPPTFL